MSRMRVGRSRISAARTGHISVRTTIPMHIANKMELLVGSTIEWDLDKVDGSWIATIRKVE